MDVFCREELEKHAYYIRRHIVHTIATNGEGHAGGAMSSVDIIATLFFGIMNYLPDDPINRDKLLLSGGHKCLALYGALVEQGLIKKAELKTYNQLGTLVPGHPDATKICSIDFSTGSLGHGLPLGCGYALSAKKQALSYKTYVIMGDGEQEEGSVWESAAFAAQNHLENLIAVIDENTLQINGRTDEICKPTSFEDRYGAFGWSVRSVDGHDVGSLYDAFSAVPFEAGKPSMIVAKTTKGKGLSIIEDNIKYHHWNPGGEEAAEAMKEIDTYGIRKGWL